MVTVSVADFAEWRTAARSLLTRGTPPDAVTWLAASDQQPLPLPGLESAGEMASREAVCLRVPRAFLALAELPACHRSPYRWDALYRLLWRVVREGSHVLSLDSELETRAVQDMARQVRRDEHKMHAFVRFAPVPDESGQRYVAWYEPDHLIVRRAAPFFAERFAPMRWSILTPDESVHWDGSTLSYAPGLPAPVRAHIGEIEALWRVYYESVYNPARVNPRRMCSLRRMTFHTRPLR